MEKVEIAIIGAGVVGLAKEDLQPDMAGIMSAIQKPGDSMKDFIIKHETDKGLPGFINLVGIESPGLTSAPAIGEMVNEMITGM